MQKLIKCSVPLVLFVALILCMSKNVEPYCGYPSGAAKSAHCFPMNLKNVNRASTIIGRDVTTDPGIDGGRLGYGRPLHHMEFLIDR